MTTADTVSPLLIAALSGAAVTVIGALVAGVIAIIRVLAETRDVKAEIIKNAATSTMAGQHRDRKLERIELLVDGRYGEVLQELADGKALLAAITGKPSDVLKAQIAQTKADEQVSRVTAAGGPTPLDPKR